MRKIVSDRVVEVQYQTGSDGLMVRTLVLPISSLKRVRGELLFKQMQLEGQEPYVLVFGWKVSEKLLSNGTVQLEVDALSDLHKEIFTTQLQKLTEGRILFP